jgi:hypothetical protein
MQTGEFDAVRGEVQQILRQLTVQELSGVRAAYGDQAEMRERHERGGGGVIHDTC